MIFVTDHAVERYIDRVKPHLGIVEARAEVHRLLEDFAAIQTEPPRWYHDAGNYADDPLTGFAMIGETIAVGLIGDRAVTVFVPGSMGEPAREARNNHRRAVQRRRRHAHRQKWKEHKATQTRAANTPRRKDWRDAAA